MIWKPIWKQGVKEMTMRLVVKWSEPRMLNTLNEKLLKDEYNTVQLYYAYNFS